ncbi:hypothetical protein DFH28DRAFT_1080968 [Melampsora americana]|nr:hypothetical protein DFH28DRAFT_1080968 [Melampsora americana]
MALKSFKTALFMKIINADGVINMVHQQWYSHSKAMSIQVLYILQSAGTTYENKPCWMICEGINDVKSHCFVHHSKFNNDPREPHTWSNLIFAFVHYAYNLSEGTSLISNLDSDKHGCINHVICFGKDSPPYHSCNLEEVADVIATSFINFCDQHRGNIICEHLGNIKLKTRCDQPL